MSELSWHQKNAVGMLSKSYDIVGYTYNADIYCPAHVHKAMDLPRLPGKSVEDSLTTYARKRGIDRDNESTFDSGYFPKVMFRDSVHDACEPAGHSISWDGSAYCADRCGNCGEPLEGECPALQQD